MASGTATLSPVGDFKVSNNYNGTFIPTIPTVTWTTTTTAGLDNNYILTNNINGNTIDLKNVYNDADWNGVPINVGPYDNTYPYSTPYIAPAPIFPAPTWPNYPTISTPTWSMSIICPHCGQQYTVNGGGLNQQVSWDCPFCAGNLFSAPFSPVQPFTMPSVPAAPAGGAPAPAKKPEEQKDHHAGDGSRWEDI